LVKVFAYANTQFSQPDQFFAVTAFFPRFQPSQIHFTHWVGAAIHFLAIHSSTFGDFHAATHRPAIVRYFHKNVNVAAHPRAPHVAVASHLNHILSGPYLLASICAHFAPAITGKANGAACHTMGIFSTKLVHELIISLTQSTTHPVAPAISVAVCHQSAHSLAASTPSVQAHAVAAPSHHLVILFIYIHIKI